MKYTFNDLADQLKRFEGLELYPYQDTTGHTTIGVGRNLDERGISENEALMLLRNDIEIVERELKQALPFVENLSDVRQRVLVDMAFNMGLPTLLQFKNMIRALKAEDWEKAADEMLNSRWAEQVGHRAEKLAEAMWSNDGL